MTITFILCALLNLLMTYFYVESSLKELRRRIYRNLRDLEEGVMGLDEAMFSVEGDIKKLKETE